MKKILIIISLFFCTTAWCGGQKPLLAEQAFAVSASLFGKDTVVVQWEIAPKHYIYKDRIHFRILKPEQSSIGTVILPTGQIKEDQIFGKYEVYKNTVNISVPIINPDPNNTIVQVSYQGCSENGYCYPPMKTNLDINFNQNNVTTWKDRTKPAPPVAETAPPVTEQDKISNLLKNGHLTTIIFSFIGFGILLAFTPCVLPMIPILSGIIVGQRDKTKNSKVFALSLIYVLSMSFTYAIAGVLVGYAGGSIQTLFQKTWVLVLFSIIFVLLALSLFGFYQIKLPARFEERIANLSRHQKSGRYISVAIMGCLATLIVSPCVTPALIGVLAYIGSSGNAKLGGIALFCMGFGMGIPLLLLGIAGGKLLPKAGAWMKTIESILGVMLLAVAIWILSRVIPGQVAMLLWALLLIVSSYFMGSLSLANGSGWKKLWKGCGFLFLVYGVLLIIGAAQGNSNPLQPLALRTTHNSELMFSPVRTVTDLDQALSRAKAEHRPVMIDFYADWCISCKEMAYTTFTNPAVKSKLQKFTLLKADVTHNDDNDRNLLNRFKVIAPPTFIFFDPNGHLLEQKTVVGKMDAAEFLQHLRNI